MADESFRLSLKESRETYWAYLVEGLYIGYRKGARKNSWKGRIKKPYMKSYFKKTFGEADCRAVKPNGHSVITFKEAVDKVIKWGATARIPRMHKK